MQENKRFAKAAAKSGRRSCFRQVLFAIDYFRFPFDILINFECVIFAAGSFLETSVPLLVLIEAARAGNEKEVEECAVVFKEHANKLVEVGIRWVFVARAKNSLSSVVLF